MMFGKAAFTFDAWVFQRRCAFGNCPVDAFLSASVACRDAGVGWRGLCPRGLDFTVMFIPLFLKTYRLSVLFNAILTKKIIDDKRLYIMIFTCVGIDIFLLTKCQHQKVSE